MKNHKLCSLIQKRDIYMKNAVLYEKDLAIIAHSILSITKGMNGKKLSPTEINASDWADNYLQQI